MTTRKPTLLPIGDIRIGRRHRKDMGDIAELAASMAEVGLLQAVGVTPDNVLIWSERRLRAAKHNGWVTIPVTVMDLDAVVRERIAGGGEGWTP